MKKHAQHGYETKHAEIRRQQRGIPQEEEAIVLTYGSSERLKNDRELRFLNRKQRDELRRRGIGLQLGLTAVFVVAVQSGAVLTAYHRH